MGRFHYGRQEQEGRRSTRAVEDTNDKTQASSSIVAVTAPTDLTTS